MPPLRPAASHTALGHVVLPRDPQHGSGAAGSLGKSIPKNPQAPFAGLDAVVCQICLPKPLPSLQSAGSAPAQPLGGCSSPVSSWHAAGPEHPAVAPAAAGTDTHRPPSTPDETLQGPVMTTPQLSPLLLSHRFLSTSSLPQIMTKARGETQPVRAAGTLGVT